MTLALVHVSILLVAASLLQLIIQADAAGNRTIDDSSLEFTFNGNWLVNSCSGCYPQPDSEQAFNRTWRTNGEGVATIRMNFTGSAIWLFGILAPAQTEGSFTVTLDAHSPVVYNVSGTSNSSYTYNNLLFSASSLSSLPHTLVLEADAGSASGRSLLFDYAVVNSDFPSTTDSTVYGAPTISGTLDGSTSASTPSGSRSVGETVGLVVGALVALTIIAILIRRYRKPWHSEDSEECETESPQFPDKHYGHGETRVVFPVEVLKPERAYGNHTEPPPVYRP